ncbi:RHS repeat-associated core domain protein, partial [gut metagenome]
GVCNRSLSNGRWYRETHYYDERGREIQRSSDNALGGVSRIDRCYDFVDNVVRKRENHGMLDGRQDVLESSYTYDKRSRLLERSVSLNGGASV